MRRMQIFLISLFLFLTASFPVQAAVWNSTGDAVVSGGTTTLTRYGTCSSGGLQRDIPIDTRSSFLVDFDYKMSSYVNQPREGIMLVFATAPVKTDSNWYSEYGYGDYIGSNVSFFGVELSSYGLCPTHESRYNQHIGLLKGDRSGVSHLAVNTSPGTLSDGNWHNLKVYYIGSVMKVYQDGNLMLSQSVSLPKLAYLGITAGTSYWGYQNHQTAKIKMACTEAKKVNFNANGGSVSVSSMFLLPRESAKLPTPSRMGHVFKGWYTAKSGGTKVNPASYALKDGQTLYAHWSLANYTLRFNANGGSVSKTSKTVTFSKKVGTLPKPTRTKGTFLGWYSAASGGTKYTANTYYSRTSGMTLYAHWKMASYKVTFNGNGGRAGRSSLTRSYGSKIGTLPSASRSGYSFLGWFTKKSGGSGVSASYIVKKNITVYAHWRKNSSGGGSSGGGSTGGGTGGTRPDCPDCRGDGRCDHCDGSGFTYSYTAKGTVKSSCFFCVYGRCRRCGGSGKI